MTVTCYKSKRSFSSRSAKAKDETTLPRFPRLPPPKPQLKAVTFFFLLLKTTYGCGQ